MSSSSAISTASSDYPHTPFAALYLSSKRDVQLLELLHTLLDEIGKFGLGILTRVLGGSIGDHGEVVKHRMVRYLRGRREKGRECRKDRIKCDGGDVLLGWS